MGRFADYLAEDTGSKPKASAPAKGGRFAQYLAEDAGEPTQPMIELPPESAMQPGSFDFKGGKGFVPEKRTRAVFTDIQPSGEPGYTAEELAGAKEDESRKKGTAFLGGTLQGATFGFGDEAAALFADKPYAEAREENRRAFKDAQSMDPKSYLMGHLAGAAAMIPATPSLAPAGKSLLTLGNMAKAAAAGGVAGLGESEADLTKGDLYGAAKDTAKGAALAAGLNTALGLAGKGYRAGKEFIAGSPERVARKADDALIDAATLGAPAKMRDELSGELGSDREGILALIKGNPELRAAIEGKRYDEAANMIRSMQTANKAAQAEEVARLDSGARTIAPAREAERVPGHRDPALNATQEMPAISMDDLVSGRTVAETPARSGALKIDVGPFIAKREERLARLKANPAPESQAEAAAEQKRIDFLRERYMPEEQLAFETTRNKVAASPIVKRLEAEHARLAANPSAEAQAEAAKMQKRIDYVKEKWIPEPKPPTPKENELLGKLMEKADANDAQRAGVNAQQFIAAAEKHGLGPAVNKGDAAVMEKADAAIDGLRKKADAIYESTAGGNLYVANMTGKLREWADELRGKFGGSGEGDAAKVERLAAGMAKWASERGITKATPRQLRQYITDAQAEAFSGRYLDPKKSEAMQRELAGKMREVLDDHVVKNGSAATLKKLDQVNKEMSALIAFRDAAKKRAAAGALKPPKPPETRTGWAPVSDAVAMANATEDPAVKAMLAEELSRQLGAPVVNPNRGRAMPSEIHEMIASTKDPDIKRELTGEFFNQIGTGPAHRITALEDEAARMSRLEAPLTHLAERGSTPPTTLRHHTGTVKGYLERGGLGAGLALMVTGNFKEGAAVAGASLVAKYGLAPARAAERGIAAMVEASRRGATATQLRSLARMAKVPKEIAEDAIAVLAPREAATLKSEERAAE